MKKGNLDFELIAGIFAELNHSKRVEILFHLANSPLKLSDLNKIMTDLSASELSRHLTRFLDKKILEKTGSSQTLYQLSPYGTTLWTLLQPTLFLGTSSEFFQNHRIDLIPTHLVNQLSKLRNAELITGTGEIMSRFSNLLQIPFKKIWIMMNEKFPIEFPSAEINFILSPKMAYYGDSKFLIQRHIHAKVLSEILIGIAFSDAGIGFLLFANSITPVPDLNQGFMISDSEGFEFLQDLWHFYWDQAVDIEEYRKKTPE